MPLSPHQEKPPCPQDHNVRSLSSNVSFSLARAWIVTANACLCHSRFTSPALLSVLLSLMNPLVKLLKRLLAKAILLAFALIT